VEILRVVAVRELDDLLRGDAHLAEAMHRAGDVVLEIAVVDRGGEGAGGGRGVLGVHGAVLV